MIVNAYIRWKVGKLMNFDLSDRQINKT